MTNYEYFKIITRRAKRAGILSFILAFVACPAAIIYGINPHALGCPWAIVGVMIGLSGSVIQSMVKMKADVARLVVELPTLIYWAHPTEGRRSFSDVAIHDCTFLVLHLRDGQKFDVVLQPPEMRAFISWLIERNPTIRLGRFDEIDPNQLISSLTPESRIEATTKGA